MKFRIPHPFAETARLREVVLDLGQALTDQTASLTATAARVTLLEHAVYGPVPAGAPDHGKAPLTVLDGGAR